MEMNFRDLLVIAGVLVVLGVLADGLRRMWLAKRRANDLNFGLEDIHGCEDDYGSELPNGGARVLHGEEDNDVPLCMPARREPFIAPDDAETDTASDEVLSAPRIVASDTVCDRPEPQPQVEPVESSLPDPVEPETCQFAELEPLVEPASEIESGAEVEPEPEPEPEPQPVEPVFSFQPEPALVVKEEPAFEQQPVQQEPFKEEPEEAENDLSGDSFSLDIKPEAEEIRVHSEAAREPNLKRKKFFERPHFHHKEREAEEGPAPEPEAPHHAPVDEVLIMNLVATTGQRFPGDQVLASFQRSGLRFGDMNIFHRHVQEDGTGEILFSVANGVEPGTFDLKTMQDSQTPALSFFMGLPGPDEPLQAFRVMVEAVHNIARDLQGSLRDDQHSVLTQQTLEHYRQRICDFERRQLTKRNKSTARA